MSHGTPLPPTSRRRPTVPLPVVLAALAAALLLPRLAPAADDPFQALVRTTPPLTPQQEQEQLKVPDGFEVQLFAAEPTINKPLNLAFDDRGRLWVTTTTEYPFPAARDRWLDPQGSRVRDSRDAIMILEDIDGDGRADRATTFLDGLNIPIGVLPYGRGCIAWSIPNLWYFEDTDGDGRCDRKTVLFGPLGFERDTHGNIASLRLGLDGWVYGTHGFNNVSRFEVHPERLGHRQPGDPGTRLELQSGNVFRFRPDGSAVELWSSGQVNPFGLAWDGWGNLYSADCHSDPVTQLLRGACYPSFGRPHDGLGFGPVMCPHRHGSTGLCGLVYVSGGVWGPEWDDHVLIGNCVTSRVNHDRVTFTGSTARASELPDFVVSGDPWFRPVDLRLGPDGALYIADFYNRIIGHYEVDLHHPGRDRHRGRIWRVVRRRSGLPSMPAQLSASQRAAWQWRWHENEQISWDNAQHAAALEVVADLDHDARIRRIAAEGLAYHPRVANIAPLLSLMATTPSDDPALLHTLRIALRNHLALPGAFGELAKVEQSVGSRADVVSVIRAVGTTEAATWLLDWLRDQRRPPDDLPALLTTIARYLPADAETALVEIVRQEFADQGAEALKLLLALRQGIAQRGGPPSAETERWARAVAEHLLAEVERSPLADWTPLPVAVNPQSPSPWTGDRRPCRDGKSMDVLTSLARPGGAAWESRVGALLSRPFACPPQLSFWLCGHRGPPQSPPHDQSLVRLVDADTGAELVRAWPPRSDTAENIQWDLVAHADRQVQLELIDGDQARGYAWLAIGRVQPPVVTLQLPRLDEPLAAVAELCRSFAMRDLAPRLAAQIAREGLSEQTRLELATAVAAAPEATPHLAVLFQTAPTRLQVRLAETLASSRAGAGSLCDMAPPRLLTAPAVARRIASLNDARLNQRVAELTADLPSAAVELDRLIAQRYQAFDLARRGGRVDPAAGRQTFTRHCAACHRVAGEGQVIGPQLDGMKNRGAERLCEDILDPNRAVDPQFRMHVLVMVDGTVTSGLVRREEGASLVLADQTGREQTLAASQIESRSQGSLSLMPSGYDQLLTPEEFNNLLAWLLTR